MADRTLNEVTVATGIGLTEPRPQGSLRVSPSTTAPLMAQRVKGKGIVGQPDLKKSYGHRGKTNNGAIHRIISDMNYLSVCSGIEAATVAWHGLGWQPVGFAEIDNFCSALLAFTYPDTRNFGDFTAIGKDDAGAIDLLVGGTPCQSFSVAGKRAGLDDPRGNLAIEFLRLAKRTCPRWILWENVPGILSSDGWRDFGAFLWALGQCGYGFAYRILDAQYFGVPQRRRRVFVVGYFGDWRPAAAVLFERESMSRNTTPRRKAREESANEIARSLRGQGNASHRADSDTYIASTLTSNGDAHSGYKDEHGLIAVNNHGERDIANALCSKNQRLAGDQETFIVSTLNSFRRGVPSAEEVKGNQVIIHENKSASLSENETARSLRSGASHSYQFVAGFLAGASPSAGSIGYQEEIAPTLKSAQRSNRTPAVCFNPDETQRRRIYSSDGIAPNLSSKEGRGHGVLSIQSGMSVRRLTPRECERLQGFPDDYTLIPYRSKPAADGPRYKALGNSMAVPKMRWLGERIEMVNRELGL